MSNSFMDLFDSDGNLKSELNPSLAFTAFSLSRGNPSTLNLIPPEYHWETLVYLLKRGKIQLLIDRLDTWGVDWIKSRDRKRLWKWLFNNHTQLTQPEVDQLHQRIPIEKGDMSRLLSIAINHDNNNGARFLVDRFGQGDFEIKSKSRIKSVLDWVVRVSDINTLRIFHRNGLDHPISLYQTGIISDLPDIVRFYLNQIHHPDVWETMIKVGNNSLHQLVINNQLKVIRALLEVKEIVPSWSDFNLAVTLDRSQIVQAFFSRPKFHLLPSRYDQLIRKAIRQGHRRVARVLQTNSTLLLKDLK